MQAKQTLTYKQRLFVEEYIKNKGNATRAAIKAGYSESTARTIGAENLTKPDILAEINKRTKAAQKRKVAQADEVLELLTKHARGKTKEEQVVVEKTGADYSEAKIVKRKVAPKDQLYALDRLARIHGLFNDKLEISTTVETSDMLRDISAQFEERGKRPEINQIDLLED